MTRREERATTGDPTPRWQYRFRNFSRAYSLLREAAEADPKRLSDLEREGLIQRFEYTFELAWKTLKDRLEYDGVQVPTATPRKVIRSAFAAGLIDDGEAWIDMLTDRNAMSHQYDFDIFEAVADKVHRRYLHLFGELWERLAAEEIAR
ncbi:MAG: nucleotidyltransferase substrate binding protein [Gemmatimonadetes bacterium]|nr:nucleotidyltransferase substrate binding protein [Gemmatimonadota bacterium]